MRALSVKAVKDSLLSRFSKETLSAAAGAVGTALVAGGVYLAQLLYQHLASESLVGLIQSEPVPSAQAKSGVSATGSSCIQPSPRPSAKPPAQSVAATSAPDVENWKLRTFASSAWASISNQDGVGGGEFSGFKISRNGSAHMDTIAGGFKGDVLGRGVYFLQKKYDSVGKADQNWWRGYHTFYDCTNNRILKCHYILGSDTDRASMLKDPWLGGQCTVEAEPALGPVASMSR